MVVDRQILSPRTEQQPEPSSKTPPKRVRDLPPLNIYRPPAARKLEEADVKIKSPEIITLPLSKPEKLRVKQRRPDIQVYVPRAKRLSAGATNDISPTPRQPVRRMSSSSLSCSTPCLPGSDSTGSCNKKRERVCGYADAQSGDESYEAQTLDNRLRPCISQEELLDPREAELKRCKASQPKFASSAKNKVYKTDIRKTESKARDDDTEARTNLSCTNRSFDPHSTGIPDTHAIATYNCPKTADIPENEPSKFSSIDVSNQTPTNGEQKLCDNETSNNVGGGVEDVCDFKKCEFEAAIECKSDICDMDLSDSQESKANCDSLEFDDSCVNVLEKSTSDFKSNVSHEGMNVQELEGSSNLETFTEVSNETNDSNSSDTGLSNCERKEELSVDISSSTMDISDQDIVHIQTDDHDTKNSHFLKGNFVSPVLVISDQCEEKKADSPIKEVKQEQKPSQETTIRKVKAKSKAMRTIKLKNGSKSAEKKKTASSPKPTVSLNKDECTWDMMFDDNGECLDPKLLEELTDAVGSVVIEKPQSDYRSFQSKPEITVSLGDEFAHVVEIYNFPATFKTEDLLTIFSPFKNGGFEIKWVDDTHALGVFSSALVASEVLNSDLPFVKTRRLCEATHESRVKARRTAEFLQPYRPRPETCAALARRLVTGALGVRLPTSREEREAERKILKEAREKKRLAAKQRESAWEGNFDV